jgi:hypothetical protein
MDRFQTEPRDHRFYTTMSLLVAVVVTTGFASTYSPKLLDGTAMPGIIHLHAAVFAAWLVAFVVQAVLAARGHLNLHRRLGLAGVGLAGVMLALGTATAITVTRAGHRGIPGVEFPDPAGFLLLNLGAAGWWFRYSPQTHKRLMLTATVGGLAPPGIARLPFVAGHTPAIGGLAMAFLLAGPLYDLVTRRRLHTAYLFAIPLVILSIPPVAMAVSSTAAWHSVAAWLMR